MKDLTSREALFCRLYASCRNAREAAFKAGYSVCPEITARKLLSQSKIVKEVKRIENEAYASSEEVRAGLRRIAFSSSADAVKLLLADNYDDIDVEALDLFNIAEIKRPKSGGIEIKLFDRIKALEKLGDISDNAENSSAKPFYAALEKSAASLEGDG